MVRSVVFILSTLFCFCQLAAQNIAFTRPQQAIPGARSDKSPSLVYFNDQYLIAWKDAGATNLIQVCQVLQKQKTSFVQNQYSIKNALSATAPILQVNNNQLYLFWMGIEGNVHYVKSSSLDGLDQAPIYTVLMNEPFGLGGINVAFSDQHCIIAGRTNAKDRLTLSVSRVDKNGILDEGVLMAVKGARSEELPIVTVIEKGSVVRISWIDRKKKAIYYADYTPANNAWQLPQSLSGALNATKPAFYYSIDTDHLVWIWKENGTDGRLHYMGELTTEPSEEETVLPDYFSTNHPVSMMGMNDTNFLVVYTGIDQQLYVSYGTKYNPASWIGDLLLPSRKNYSLKDIVIPGSHDAGMSMLTGVGGKGENTINECNTLTQVLTIEKQLNAGIRMFDLRIDQKKGEFYTKHAPADCMEDAIAGGYGEKLSVVLQSVKDFLDTNKGEFVILSFCHFCTKTSSLADQAKTITEALGEEKLFRTNGKKLPDITLGDLAGKVLLTFENYSFPEIYVAANSMTESKSEEFINYRREYAATNQITLLVKAQRAFFTQLKEDVQPNDLVRLDWQLTQASQEAVLVCNEFQSKNTNPLIDSFILLTNTLKKNKSIRELAFMGNRYLSGKIVEWIEDKTIVNKNKPNILYVDIAGTWITEFCIALNRESIYQQ